MAVRSIWYTPLKLACCFAGGGSRGIIQAGYAKALIESGRVPDFIFGTSVGALNACMFVQGDADKLYELWTTVKNKQVYQFHFWTIAQLLLNRNHVYDSSPLKELIDKFIDFPRLQDRGLNFQITATNLTDWKTESYGPRDLTEQEFKTFLLASASPPMAFPPVQFRGKQYGDGGLINNFNTSNAVKAGADFILILTPTVRDDTKINNMIDMFNILTSLPEYCYLDRELAYLDKINEVQAPYPNLREIKHGVVRPERSSGIGLLDFDMSGIDRVQLMSLSYESARKQLDNLFNQA